jgi:MFS family permease
MWHFSSLTLTAIFGVYALALLAALLTTGRLSDHLGRRPVVLLALVVQIVSMVAFIDARGVGMLFAARVLQGLGTGLATSALSAWLLDLQPPDHPRLGSLVASVAPVAGLASGALVSGLLVQYGPDPLRLVFSLLCAVYALAFAAMTVIAANASARVAAVDEAADRRAAGGSLPVRRLGSRADRDVGPGRALSVAGTLAGPLLAQ